MTLLLLSPAQTHTYQTLKRKKGHCGPFFSTIESYSVFSLLVGSLSGFRLRLIGIVFVLVSSDFHTTEVDLSFGGLRGREVKKQDPPIERDLHLALEDLFYGCTKMIKISRRVRCSNVVLLLGISSSHMSGVFIIIILQDTHCSM